MKSQSEEEPPTLYNKIFQKLTYIFSEPHLAEIGRLTDDIIKSTEQTMEIRKDSIQSLLEEVGIRGKSEEFQGIKGKTQ